MDLLALCSGSYAEAVAQIEKRAEEKVANQFQDWVDKNLGAAARSETAKNIGNWWRDAGSDPRKLALIGAGGGLGLGALGGAMGPKGRRKPFQSGLLGALMGGAALGGVGLLNQKDPIRAARKELNEAQEKLKAMKAEEELTKLEGSGRFGAAVGENLKDVGKNLASGNFSGAFDSAGRAFRAGDVLGAGELIDAGDSNKKLAPGYWLNRLQDNTVLDTGRRAPESYAAPQLLIGMGLADRKLRNMANDPRRPEFLQAGLLTDPGRATLQKALNGAGSVDEAAKALEGLSPSATRRAVGGTPVLQRVVNNIPYIGGTSVGSGFDYTPGGVPTPAAAPAPVQAPAPAPAPVRAPAVPPAPAGPAVVPPVDDRPTRPVPSRLQNPISPNARAPVAQATPGVPAAAQSNVHLNKGTLRTIALEGRKSLANAEGEAVGLLRSGFGSAQGGRLGGTAVPRGLAYPSVTGGISWLKTRPEAISKATSAVEAAQAAETAAQMKLRALEKAKTAPKLKLPTATPAPVPTPAG